MSDIDGLEAVEGGVEQLLSVTKQSIADLNNLDKQLVFMSTAVHNFVMQTMQQINGNTDVAEVNQALANALLQIKEFVTNRQSNIRQAEQQLLAKKDAFEQTLLLVGEAKPTSTETPTVEVDLMEKKREILKDFDSTGKYKKKNRKVGARPESLKTIRALEAELAAQKNLEEDN